MTGPLFSLIVPSYNAAQTIRATLESIQKQHFSDYEVIVMDGGSSDESVIIARSVLPNAMIMSERDSGVYDAINKGIEKAQGQYVYIIGSDDLFANDEVLESVAKLTHTRPDLIFGDIQYFDKKNLLVPNIHRSKWNNSIYWKNTLHQQGCFYKREIFDRIKFNPQYKVLGDYDVHLFLFTHSFSNVRYDALVAACAAQGLSKQFGFDLYREELHIKKNRLPFLLYLLNVLWVRLKYLAKNIF